MNRKKYIWGGVINIVLLLTFLYLFIIPQKLTITIGVANPPSENIDLLIKIDKKQIFEDTLRYRPFDYIKLEKKFQGIKHDIYISSEKINTVKEKTVFTLFKRHITIQYFPQKVINIDNDTSFIKDSDSFLIDTSFAPFYYE